MEIVIVRQNPWANALDSALWTSNKEERGKEPSEAWVEKACMAEHSMLREIHYDIYIYGVPTWVSQHIARHDAFAGHNVREGAMDTHFVGTQRTDRTGFDRNKMPQDALCNHKIHLSAQDFITISRLRVCNCASKETRELWWNIIETLKNKGGADSILASKCVPNCIYRGRCPEFKSCGYSGSNAHKKMLEEYWNGRV